MAGEREGLRFDEAAEESWLEYLRSFKDDVYPMFKPYGFTLPEAFSAWMQNKLHNAVDSLVERIDDGH